MSEIFLPSETNIFISYRRSDGLEYARIIYMDLLHHGYSNIFFDYSSLRDGPFDSQIEVAIRSCKDFIIILSPQSMNRCYLLDDWVARELRLAIKYNRKIIPVSINTSGFRWPDNFPSDLKILCSIQRHCMLTNEYFPDSMRMLAKCRLQTNPIKKITRDSIDLITKGVSQPLPYLRNVLKQWKGCRLASFNDYGQGVIVRGKKDVLYTDNIPTGMKQVFNKLVQIPYVYIAEVCVTEFYWFVIYNDGAWHGKGYVPERFKKSLDKVFRDNIPIRCVTMNNKGDYLVVTHKGYMATRQVDKELVIEGVNSGCGKIISAQITDDAALISFERGIKGRKIPSDVKQNLLEFSGGDGSYESPKLVRFTDGGLCLFGSENGYCCYL